MKKAWFFHGQVNRIENSHPGTIYLYTYKVKKPPRLVGGRQPPPAALDLHSRALGLVPTWTRVGEGSSSHAFFITYIIYYSARGGSCD